MNKTAVKNYAVEARKKWIQAIAQQAAFYGCTEKGSLGDAEITKQLADKGVFLTASEKSDRTALVNDINKKGYQNAIEEIAYTWFNRLIAIRFMEVNGYLPSGIRVLSSIDLGRIEPDCVREYARLDFLNQDTAAKLAAESDEKLYRYILVEQCNALGFAPCADAEVECSADHDHHIAVIAMPAHSPPHVRRMQRRSPSGASCSGASTPRWMPSSAMRTRRACC